MINKWNVYLQSTVVVGIEDLDIAVVEQCFVVFDPGEFSTRFGQGRARQVDGSTDETDEFFDGVRPTWLVYEYHNHNLSFISNWNREIYDIKTLEYKLYFPSSIGLKWWNYLFIIEFLILLF